MICLPNDSDWYNILHLDIKWSLRRHSSPFFWWKPKFRIRSGLVSLSECKSRSSLYKRFLPVPCNVFAWYDFFPELILPILLLIIIIIIIIITFNTNQCNNCTLICNIPSLQNMDTFCTDEHCHEGILIEKRCAKSKQKCALLLSSYPGELFGSLWCS